MIRTFHKDIGLPRSDYNFGTVFLNYSLHAKKASKTDKYGEIKLPEALNTSKAEVIEVEYTDGVLSKVLYRANYSNEHDIIIALVIGT